MATDVSKRCASLRGIKWRKQCGMMTVRYEVEDRDVNVPEQLFKLSDRREISEKTCFGRRLRQQFIANWLKTMKDEEEVHCVKKWKNWGKLFLYRYSGRQRSTFQSVRSV